MPQIQSKYVSYYLRTKHRETDTENLFNPQRINTGITVSITIPGYTSLIKSLSLYPINNYIISRGVETILELIIDSATSIGGDVQIQDERIRIYWRIAGNQSSFVKMILNWAIFIHDNISKKQLYVLEELDSYKGFRFGVGIGVCLGVIEDLEMGIEGFIQSHIIHSDRLLVQDGVWCSNEVWEKVEVEYLEKVQVKNGKVRVTGQVVSLDKLKELYANLKDLIQFNDQGQPSFCSLRLEPFVGNLALNLANLDKREIIGVYYPGTWKDTMAVSILFKCRDYLGDRREKLADCQACLEIILKIANHYQLSIYSADIPDQGFDKFLVQLVSFTASQSAVMKFAMNLIEKIGDNSPDSQYTISITSGRCYEGFLKTEVLNAYRLIGDCLSLSEQAASTSSGGILVDQETFDKLSDNYAKGILKKCEENSSPEVLKNFYQVKRKKEQNAKVSHTSIILGSFVGAFDYPLSQLHNFAMDVKIRKITGTVLVSGSQGSGKSTFLNQSESPLSNLGYVILSAECHQNEAFSQPLFPFVSLLPQIIHAFDSLSSMTYSDCRSRSSSAAHSKFKLAAEVLPKQDVSQIASPFSISSLVDKFAGAMTDHPKRFKFRTKSTSENHPSQAEATSKSSTLNDNRKIRKKRETIWERYRAKIFHSKDKRVHPNISTETVDDTKEKNNPEALEFLKRLTDMLVQNGEDTGIILPLLNPIIQADVPDTIESSKIEPDGRTLLLSGLFVRLLDRISALRPCVFILDDFQFIDSASFVILTQIINRCKNILVLMATSPVKGWRARSQPRIENPQMHLNINLNEIGIDEISEVMKIQFEFWASDIDPVLVDFVRNNSQGKLAHVPIFIAFLKEKDLLEIKGDQLSITNDMQDYASTINTNLEDMLLTQFDSLESKEFKSFLIRASVVGRCFSLEEVCSTMDFDQSKSQEIMVMKIGSMIKLFDFYGMIAERDVGRQKGHNYPFQLDYIFVNSELRDVIYKKRLGDVERKAIHLRLLRFYEQNIDKFSEPTFLPRICNHGRFSGFADRDSIIQHLQYCVMLGNFLCLSCEAYKETIAIYTHCKQLIRYNFLEQIIGETVISEMYVRLGQAFSRGLPDEVNMTYSAKYLMAAMEALKFKWPKSDSEWRKLQNSQMFFWAITNWAKPLMDTLQKTQNKRHYKWRKYILELFGNDDFSRNSKLERLEHLQPVFEEMSKIMFYTDAPKNELTACELLVLNNSFKIGKFIPCARLLMPLAIKLWYVGYRTAGKVFADRCAFKYIEPRGFAAGTVFWISTGNWKSAYDWAEKGIKLSVKRGDFRNWLACTKELSFLRLIDGDFKEAVKIETERLNQSKMNGYREGVLSAEVALSCIEILRDNAENRRKRTFESDLKIVSHATKAQYLAVQAHSEIRDKNYQKGLDRIESLLGLLEKCNHIENNILIVVLLSILAIRSVSENAKKDAKDHHQRKFSSIAAITGVIQQAGTSFRRASMSAVGNGYALTAKKFPTAKNHRKTPAKDYRSSADSSIKMDLPALPTNSEENFEEIEKDEVNLNSLPHNTAANVAPIKDNSVKLIVSEDSNENESSGHYSLKAHYSLKVITSEKNLKLGLDQNDNYKNANKLGNLKSSRSATSPRIEDHLEQKEYISPMLPEASAIYGPTLEEIGKLNLYPVTERRTSRLSTKGFNNRFPSYAGFKSPVEPEKQDYTFRLKFLIKQLIEKLAGYSNHICAEPLLLVLKAQFKSLEPGAAEKAMMLSDGPEALKKWVNKPTKSSANDMKLINALLLIACAKLGKNSSQDYSKELHDGNNLLQQMEITNFYE